MYYEQQQKLYKLRQQYKNIWRNSRISFLLSYPHQLKQQNQYLTIYNCISIYQEYRIIIKMYKQLYLQNIKILNMIVTRLYLGLFVFVYLELFQLLVGIIKIQNKKFNNIKDNKQVFDLTKLEYKAGKDQLIYNKPRTSIQMSQFNQARLIKNFTIKTRKTTIHGIIMVICQPMFQIKQAIQSRESLIKNYRYILDLEKFFFYQNFQKQRKVIFPIARWFHIEGTRLDQNTYQKPAYLETNTIQIQTQVLHNNNKLLNTKMVKLIVGQQIFVLNDKIHGLTSFFHDLFELQGKKQDITLSTFSTNDVKRMIQALEIKKYNFPIIQRVNQSDPIPFLGKQLSQFLQKLTLNQINSLYKLVAYLRIEPLKNNLSAFVATKIFIKMTIQDYRKKIQQLHIKQQLTNQRSKKLKDKFAWLN